ncbi:MAG: dephospho-CoA kinase [Pseudomonadales bacterium]|nr:dephospho-CoA kinase [Pseudomonadales bacterium]
MKQLIIGLTGGIGSGKTAVSDLFAARGITIADADVASREVVQPGMPALGKIVAHFGEQILLPDGSMDRAALRSIVFSDPAERKFLESVTVPAIMNRLQEILENSTSPYAILMLSSGSGQHPWIRRHLVVDVSEATQLARVTARDQNEEAQVRAIMATQPTRQQRLDYADDVITNEGTLAALEQQVDQLHNKYLILSGSVSSTPESSEER